MLKNKGKYINQGLLVLRLLMGVMIFLHGYLKFTGGEERLTLVGSAVSHVGIQSGHYVFGIIAASFEVLAGILLFFGLFHNIACLMMCSVLGVAVIMRFSTNSNFSATAYPLEMWILFFSLLFIGPGKYSIDNKIFNK